MNEHGFIRSIHRKLPSSVYIWKINDNFAGGVADAYYSGVAGDLWIEYKYAALPKKDASKVVFGLSAQQIQWLTNRFREGRTVAVVIGSDHGCLLLRTPEEWSHISVTKAFFNSNSVDKTTVVAFIIGVIISTTDEGR